MLRKKPLNKKNLTKTTGCPDFKVRHTLPSGLLRQAGQRKAANHRRDTEGFEGEEKRTNLPMRLIVKYL